MTPLKELLKRKSIAFMELALKVGVSPSTFYKALSGKAKMPESAIKGIARELEMMVEQVRAML